MTIEESVLAATKDISLSEMGSEKVFLLYH
jgi:hypothetical protein